MEIRYAGINKNDIANGQNISVSFFCQGCPHRCKGCHNPETWNETGGELVPDNIGEIILDAIKANGITRNFSMLGGEPLVGYNLPLVRHLIQVVREGSPESKIYLWTGYLLEDLDKNNDDIKYILNNVDILIDGPFVLELRDITLPLRGSTNQRVIDMPQTIKNNEIMLWDC